MQMSMLKKTSHSSSRPSPGEAKNSVSPAPNTVLHVSAAVNPLPLQPVGLSTSCGVCVRVCVWTVVSWLLVCG